MCYVRFGIKGVLKGLLEEFDSLLGVTHKEIDGTQIVDGSREMGIKFYGFLEVFYGTFQIILFHQNEPDEVVYFGIIRVGLLGQKGLFQGFGELTNLIIGRCALEME
jgi:hypothetical protein